MKLNEFLTPTQIISLRGELRREAESYWCRLGSLSLAECEGQASILGVDDTKDAVAITIPVTIYLRKVRRG